MRVRVGQRTYGVPAFSRYAVMDDGTGPIAFVETVSGTLHALTGEGEVGLPGTLHQSVRDLLAHAFTAKL